MKHILPVCIFILLFCTGLQALEFEHYSIKNGLPDNKVHCFRQDSYGLLWMGTSRGIARFDGIHFTSFLKNENDSTGLVDDYITDIFEVRKNLLLFTTGGGMLIAYDYTTGSFKNLSNHTALSSIEFIRGFRLNSGEIWYSTSEGIAQLSEQLTLIKYHKVSFKEKAQTQSYAVYDIIEGNNGNLYLSTFTQQLVVFSKKTESFTQPFFPAHPLFQIHQLIRSADGKHLYGATGGRGLFVVSPADNTAREISFSSPDGQFRNGLFCVTELSPGELLIGTGSGMLRYYTTTGKTEAIIADERNPKSLTDNIVSSIYKTTDGTIWVATSLGVHKTVLRKKSFVKFSQYPPEANEYPEITHAQFVLPYNENTLIFGHGKGLTFYNTTTGKKFQYRIPNIKGQHNESVPFCAALQNNTLWIGTWGNGLYKITLTPSGNLPAVSSLSQFVHSASAGSLANDFIKSVNVSPAGGILLGTWGSGVVLLSAAEAQKTSPHFETISLLTLFPQTGGNFINYSFTDKYGCIRAGTGERQFVFSENGNIAREVNVPVNEKQRKTPLIANTCLVLNDTQYVTSGVNGLVLVTVTGPGAETTQWLASEPSIPVFQTARSLTGDIWILSSNGRIYRLNRNNNSLSGYDAYTETGGFRESYGFGSTDRTGRIYFSSMSGFISFHPDSLSYGGPVKQCIITSIRTGAVSLPAADPVMLKKIETDYTNSGITISFSPLDYNSPDRYLYSYRLLGSVNEWSLPFTDPQVNFSKLEPGEYIFQVKIFTAVDEDNPAFASLAISVTPPFYKTFLFRMVTAFFFAGLLIYSSYRAYRYLRAEQLRQKEYNRILITTQEQERSRVAKELHDSIGQNLLVIKNLLGLYKRKTGAEDEDLTSLDSIILRSIDEVRSISSSLHPHQLTRYGLTTTLKNMCSTVAEASGISISFTDNSNSFEFGANASIGLYRIVQEALNNIIKHSGATAATITLECKDNTIVLTAGDNGKGFSESKAPGSGMFNMKERAAYLNGKMETISTENGTTLMFTFKGEDLNA